MADQKRFEKIVTPKGKAVFPYLTSPDTKFNESGEYKVNLRLPKEDAAELMEKINEKTEEHWNETYNQAKAAAKKKMQKHFPYDDIYDEETEEPTGDVMFKFRMNAQVKKKDGTVVDLQPKVFDKYGRATTKYVGGGSIIRVNAQLVPYHVAATGHVGISLRLNAVQVLEFNSGGSAEDFGFEVEEAMEAEGTEDSDSEEGDF